MATSTIGGLLPSESSLFRFNPYQTSSDDLSQDNTNNNVSNSNNQISSNTSVLVDVVTLSGQSVNVVNPDAQSGLDQNGLYNPQTIPRNISQTNVSVSVNVDSELNIVNGNGSLSLSNSVDVDVNIDISEILRQLTGKDGDGLSGFMQSLRVNVDVNLRQSIGTIGRGLGIGNRNGMEIRGNSLNSILNLGQMRKMSRLGTIDTIKNQIEKLYELDPELLKDYLLILATFLDKEPEGLQSFLDKIQNVLDKLGKVNGNIGDIQEAVQQPPSQSVSASISTRVEVFVKQIQNGSNNSIDVEVNVNTQVNVGQGQQADPIMFDLDGDGFETTGAGNGADFDINGDGNVDKTSFANGDDAFLAFDKNGNGKIDGGQELFGDQNGAKNGIEELKKYDSNNDNYIDEKDPIFNDLMLLKSGSNELTSLKNAGISAIKLNLINYYQKMNNNDFVNGAIEFIRNDGSRGLAGDVMLNYY